jgi:hypothetical protein
MGSEACCSADEVQLRSGWGIKRRSRARAPEAKRIPGDCQVAEQVRDEVPVCSALTSCSPPYFSSASYEQRQTQRSRGRKSRAPVRRSRSEADVCLDSHLTAAAYGAGTGSEEAPVSPTFRLACIALVAASAACSDDQEPSPPSRIASITFSQDSVILNPGGVYALPAPEARDTRGQVLSDVTYTWSSTAPYVATVNATGRVAGVAVGGTIVSASAEDVSGTITVIVVPLPLHSLELLPAAATLLPGSAVQVVAQFLDTAGQLVFVPQDEVLWSSSDAAVVGLRRSENPVGQVRVVAAALQAGEAVITARRGTLSASATIKIVPESFLAVVAGGTHACAITASHRTYCWGASSEGQLGGGLPDLHCLEYSYCSTVPLLVHGEERFERLSLGSWHSCGLTSGGEPFCWGGGLENAMRAGSTQCLPLYLGFPCVPEPLRIELTGVGVAIAAADNYGCVLDSQGMVRCWGVAQGLGTATVPSTCIVPGVGGYSEYPCSPDPIEIDDPGPFRALDAGGHTCALTPEGEARCWGPNGSGQLGRGDTSSVELPGPVSGGIHFDQITAGGAHTCALASGTAYCWGSNRYDQLGSTVETSCGDLWPAACEPRPVAGHLFTRISAGVEHTCALDASGTAWCWGRNAVGQLGDGTTQSSMTPVAVSGGLVFQEISAGGDVTCGYTTNGQAYCWGDTLGIVDGVLDHLVPTKVPGQP